MSNSNKSRVALEAENYELKQKIKLLQTKYKQELDNPTFFINITLNQYDLIFMIQSNYIFNNFQRRYANE